MSKNKNLSGGLFASGKPRPLTIKETPLSAQIKEYLDKRSLWSERLNAGKIQTKPGYWITLCEKGTPDRLTLICGIAVFIETKCAAKNRATISLKNTTSFGETARS